MDYLLGQATQVVDHNQPEHDGNGPDFTNGQGRNGLVSLHEARDVGLVQTTITVSDEFQGQRVDPRKACERAARQLGQQFVVTAWQIGAYFRQSIGNDMEVV